MRILYLLHRFPTMTDTFIRREIRAVEKAGMEIQIISVWRPSADHAAQDIMEEWSPEVRYILPQSYISILRSVLSVSFSAPSRFFSALLLAFGTSRPGFRGFLYQMFYFFEALLAAHLIRRSRIDHIHNHFGDQSGIVTMLVSKLTNIGYSISFHGPHVFFDAKNGAIKEKVHNACFIRCISYFCRSQLIFLSSIRDCRKLRIIHCGLELDKYTFRIPRTQLTRLFCAARLSHEKGLVFLFQAVAHLVKSKHDVCLRIAGDGPDRRALDLAARDLGIIGRVSFLGNLNEQAVISELSSCDLFVLPSLAEGVPVSVMEAMALGVPVVTTSVGGTSELVESGKTGILVQPTDAMGLADVISTLIEDYDLRCQIASLARAKIASQFDVLKESAKLAHCFANANARDLH